MARDSARTMDNLLKENDVLISIRGPMKVAVAPAEADGYSFSAEFAALEIDTEKISPEIVVAYLRLPHVNTFLENRSPVKTMRSISLKDILEMEIHLPDKEKQDKIVEVLSLIAEQQKIMAEEQGKLNGLKDSLMMQMVGGIKP